MEAETNLTFVTEFILVGLTDNWKMQMLLFALFLIIYSFTVLGNLAIILLVRLDSRLHTPMYFFLTQLSSLEICYVTCTVPQMLAHLLTQNRTISFARCAAQLYLATFLGSTECILLCTMAYDRYVAICHPLLYAVIMGRWRQVQLAALSWAGALLIEAINVGCILRLPFCGPNRINHFLCEGPMMLKLACSDRHSTEVFLFATSTLVLLPFSVILISYGLILSSVLRIRSVAGRRKAFSTCASHLMVVTLFYGTIIFMYMRPSSDNPSSLDKQIAVFYIIITPLLNPIIYTLRNKEIHGAVAKVLQRWGVAKTVEH